MANRVGYNAHDYIRFSKTQTSFAETSAKFQDKVKNKMKNIMWPMFLVTIFGTFLLKNLFNYETKKF